VAFPRGEEVGGDRLVVWCVMYVVVVAAVKV